MKPARASWFLLGGIVLTLPASINLFITGRIDVESVPSAAAICSPRWLGLLFT